MKIETWWYGIFMIWSGYMLVLYAKFQSGIWLIPLGALFACTFIIIGDDDTSKGSTVNDSRTSEPSVTPSEE